MRDDSPHLSSQGPTLTQIAAPAPPQETEKSTRPPLLSRLLRVATFTSIISTVAFAIYLLLPILQSKPRGAYSAFYVVGLVGGVVAEVCQILAVTALIGLWFSRANPQKKGKELLMLVASLIPYVLALIFLITLIVYLRDRRRNPTAAPTQEAAQELKEQRVDALVDLGNQVAGFFTSAPPSVSAAPMPPPGAPTPPAPQPGAPTYPSVGTPYPSATPTPGSPTAPAAPNVPAYAGMTPNAGGAPYPSAPASPGGAQHPTAASAGPVSSGEWSPATHAASPTAPRSAGTRSTLLDAVRRVIGPSTSKSLSKSSSRFVALTMVALLLTAIAGLVVPVTRLGPLQAHSSSGSTRQTSSGPGQGASQVSSPTTSAAPGTIKEFSLPSNTQPTGIALGSDGALWFGEQGNSQIGRITASGAIQQFDIQARISSGQSVTAGPDGAIWFTYSGAGGVGRITPSGSVQLFSAPTANSAVGIGNIAAGPDGNLWFTDTGSNTIGRITPSGSIQEFNIPTANSAPIGITKGPDGNVWFAESGRVGLQSGTSKIGRITPSGSITEFSLPSAQSGAFGITTGPDGNLWFTDYEAGEIGRITPSGSITEFPLPTANNGPWDIAAGPDGNLWFTESAASQVGRITPNGVVTEYPITGGEPSGITAGPDGNLWFTEFSSDQIGVITP